MIVGIWECKKTIIEISVVKGVREKKGANAENIAKVTLFGKTGAVSISSINILCSHYVPELITWVVCNINLECIAKEF